jgi:hypothetical protein
MSRLDVPARDAIGDAAGDGAGLARSGSGENADRAGRGDYRRLLLIVETSKH